MPRTKVEAWSSWDFQTIDFVSEASGTQQISERCESSFGVKFLMFSKLSGNEPES